MRRYYVDQFFDFRGSLMWVLIGVLALTGAAFTMRADDAAKPPVYHEFRYKPDANSAAKTINLAGDFNSWSTTTTPMVKADDGTFRVTVKLTPGKHVYKFVLDGTTWTNDPAADKSLEEDDGQQGKNSGVVITADDKTAADQIEHTFSYHPTDGSSPKSVNVAGDFNNWSVDATPLTRAADGNFTATVKLPAGTYHYKFVIEGSKWISDSAADKALDQDDQHGGTNSGISLK